MTSGRPLVLSGLQFALLQSEQLGTRDLPLRPLPPCDSSSLSLGSGRGPSPSPRLVCLHTLHSRRNTPPLSCQAWAWQSLDSREGRSWGNNPSRSSCGVRWPVASHNRPRDTEGRLSGGPAVSFKPTLSPWPTACLFFPPSQAAVPAPSFVRRWDVDVAWT